MAARNDSLMNPYIPTSTMGWLANTDMSPCTNAAAVLNYLAKYASKAEEKSESYKEIFHNVTRQVSNTSRRPLLSAVTKMLNSLIGERDWPAQEVSHLLLDLPLVECSRRFRTLDLRPEAHMTMEIDDGEIRVAGKSWLQKYTERLVYHHAPELRPQLEQVTLLEFLQCWDVGRKNGVMQVWKRRMSSKHFVIKIFPHYSPTGDKEGQEYEDFCRVKVMLNHSFNDPEMLKSSPDEFSEPTFRHAYTLCCQTCPDHPPDPYDDIDGDGDDVSEYSDPEEADDIPQLDWVEYAGRRGNLDGVRLTTDALGDRPQDREYDWRRSGDEIFAAYGDQQNFMRDAKQLEVSIQRTYNDPDTLQTAQRTCFDRVIDQYRQILAGEAPEQLFLHVDGSAGTGKSYLIDMISTHLFEMARNAGRGDPVLRGAPTGVAAFNIQGRTLHSLLYLPVRKGYSPLGSSSLLALQTVWRDCRFLIIDEKSMLGLKQLHWIDARLREIFPHRAEEPFAGINIIMLGDFCQLPPVGEKALYNGYPSDSIDVTHAQTLYRPFNRTVVLTQIMRQQGEDDISRGFRAALEELREGTISDEAYSLLHRRVQANLEDADRANFSNALRLYPTKSMVNEFNMQMLKKKRSPVIHIKAKHNSKAAERGTDEDAEGLHADIYLSKGARVMLTNNLLTPFGLVNGSMGVLHDIVWLPEEDPLTNLPCMILFKPDKYPADGPCLFRTADGHAIVPIVPIVPIMREWEVNHQKLQRTAFPIVLAYAITVHKSQGLTLDRVVLDLTLKDFAVGLTYVAISRARSLLGIIFDHPFTKARFKQPSSSTRQMRIADQALRAEQML